MLCCLRFSSERWLSYSFFRISSTKYSTKSSQVVKPVNLNDQKKPEYYETTRRVEFLPVKSIGHPSSIIQYKSDVEEWSRIKTDWSNLPFLYMKLSKIRLTSLVVITTVAGYVAGTAPFDLASFICCCIGTGLVSSAANAMNQYHEVPFDAQMSRTKNRVLVKQQLSPLHALGFATATSLTGLSILYSGCNPLTAILGVSNLFLYTCIYTPLKRMSILNTWVGSVVGAIPPMMGWASCTGGLEAGAWLLGAMLFAWQFPHFNALSWNLRPDYSRAGYRMMSVTNPGLCRRTALRYTAAITGLCFLAPVCDITNNYFLLEMLPLNLYFTYLAYKFYKDSDSASSRKLFRFSLVHLPLLITLLLVNKNQWFLKANSNSEIEKKVTPAPIKEKTTLSNLDASIINTSKM